MMRSYRFWSPGDLEDPLHHESEVVAEALRELRAVREEYADATPRERDTADRRAYLSYIAAGLNALGGEGWEVLLWNYLDTDAILLTRVASS